MPEQAVIARRTPCIVEIDPGTVYTCQCGRSKSQPFLDGSHTGTMFSPMEIYFEEKKRMAFCGCSRQKASLLRRVSLANLTGCGKTIGHSRHSTACHV
jgi:CDGSH-type Zn-finger protein